MTTLPRVCSLLLLAPVSGCLQLLPEASLRGDVPLAVEMMRVERALGVPYLAEPVRELRPASEVFEVSRRGLLERPAGNAAGFEEAVYAMFRAASEPHPPSAAAVPAGTHDAPIAYDADTGHVLLAGVSGEPPAESSGTSRAERNADLARTDAFARALLAQRHELRKLVEAAEGGAEKAGKGKLTRDAIEGRLGSITGAAHAGVLDATLSPISGFDAGAGPIRRYHAALTARLLLDPDGAPARELARSDVPDAERRALEALLETSGMERRRRILRIFAAAQLYLEARDRVTMGNFESVYASPPASSEQLLHPDRWLDRDDPPIAITEGRRAGLLGVAWTVVDSQVAGEFGVLNALEGVLAPGEASRAACGWGGDLLTVYRNRENGAPAYAWRFECDDRFAANRLCAALQRAVVARCGGEFVEIADEVFELTGGSMPCRMHRKDPSLAFVLGGKDELQLAALDELLLEMAERPDGETRAAGHDPAYRMVRAVASPFFFDRPGRFDTRAYSLYGWLFRHRRAALDGEFEGGNWSEFPILGALLPVDLHGFFFTWERGELRRDVSFFQQGIRWHRDLVRGRSRFWSPLVSWIRGDDYRQTGVMFGFLFVTGEGSGREEMSPRIAWSHSTELDGARTKWGFVLDAVGHSRREGFGTRTELLPYGALMGFERRDDPDGFSIGFLLDALRLRRVKTLPDRPSFDLSLFWNRGARFFADEASGSREVSLLAGIFAGHFGAPRRHGTGLGGIGGRWLFGFGAEDGRAYCDFLWLRIGG